MLAGLDFARAMFAVHGPQPVVTAMLAAVGRDCHGYTAGTINDLDVSGSRSRDSSAIVAGLVAGLDVYRAALVRVALYGRLQRVLLSDTGLSAFTAGLAVRW